MNAYKMMTLCMVCGVVAVATTGVRELSDDGPYSLVHTDKYVHSDVCKGRTDTYNNHCRFILGSIDLDELEVLLIEGGDIDSINSSKPLGQDNDDAPVPQLQQADIGFWNDVLRG